jgi:uncharacterized C2H2 Zn-finger protein
MFEFYIIFFNKKITYEVANGVKKYKKLKKKYLLYII